MTKPEIKLDDLPKINPGYVGDEPFCAPGQCKCAYKTPPTPHRQEQTGCVRMPWGFAVGYREPCTPALTQQRDEYKAEVERLKTATYCAYCGEDFPLDTITAEQVSEHIRTCRKHPMREAEADRDRYKKALELACGYIATMTGHCPNWLGWEPQEGCEEHCNSDHEKCWALYFEEQVKND